LVPKRLRGVPDRGGSAGLPQWCAAASAPPPFAAAEHGSVCEPPLGLAGLTLVPARAGWADARSKGLPRQFVPPGGTRYWVSGAGDQQVAMGATMRPISPTGHAGGIWPGIARRDCTGGKQENLSGVERPHAAGCSAEPYRPRLRAGTTLPASAGWWAVTGSVPRASLDTIGALYNSRAGSQSRSGARSR
jgi:hypothetical protein